MGTTSIEDVTRQLKGFKSEIGTLDTAVNNMAVRIEKGGHMSIGGESVGSFNRILREGDLAKLMSMSDVRVPFTNIDEAAFKSVVKDTAEFKMRVIRDTAEANKKIHPELNVTEDGFANASAQTTKSVEKAEGNMLKSFGRGTKLALTVGVITVGSVGLYYAVRARKGCIMSTTIDDQTTSCKIQSQSCVGEGGTMCPNPQINYNVTLILMQLSTMEDTHALKVAVCSAAGIQPSELNTRLVYVIDSKFDEVAKVINASKNNLPTFDPCSLKHPGVEGGEIAPCRMCSPSANPKSTEYIDPSTYPDNVTFSCNSHPNILDVIADVALTTGVDLLDGIGSGIFAVLKPFVIAIVVILVLVLIISIVSKIAPRRQRIDVGEFGSQVSLIRNAQPIATGVPVIQ